MLLVEKVSEDNVSPLLLLLLLLLREDIMLLLLLLLLLLSSNANSQLHQYLVSHVSY